MLFDGLMYGSEHWNVLQSIFPLLLLSVSFEAVGILNGLFNGYTTLRGELWLRYNG